MTNTLGSSAPGAQDECATCSHMRWRHREVDGQQVCTEYLDCACQGHFVELSQATRMARFVDAAQKVAATIATMRDALQAGMRATAELYTAMQVAGLLPDETGLCDGCDRTDRPVTATDDGRAQLCPACTIASKATDLDTRPRVPAYSTLADATWHRPDCDKTCGGTCTQGGDATQFIPAVPDPTGTWEPGIAQGMPDAGQLAGALGIPEAAITGPSPDGLPDHWAQAAPTQHPGNSCATCWPRPCERPGGAYRSECRRNPNARSDEEATQDGAVD